MFQFIDALLFSENLSTTQKAMSQLNAEENKMICASCVVFSNVDVSAIDSSLSAASLSKPEIILAKIYTNHAKLFSLYTVDIPDPNNYVVDIKVDPCRLLKPQFCIEGANEALYTNQFNVTGGGDLLVAWFLNVYTIKCGNEFAESDECGTFLEVHRPFDERVLASTRIVLDYSDGYAFDYISLRDICAGRYEIWFVFRMPIGRFIQHIKPFFILSPSCGPDQVINS
eukprot:TRINITY_DN11215_c0_g1_i1.p1 TRINITY_DN11215_c0_g1~~TRINITY_DN11215_c0_g1_i1.p1  ORF type:complete len:227 (+),score=32.01 TRINITY_DN11215_c0_g1_i1:195-875(+)